jgi:hypothetical protein
MRINESTFRKILREEARRALHEVEGTPPAAAPAGAVATNPAAQTVYTAPTAAASGAVTTAKANHETAYKAADAESDRLVQVISNKGPAAQPLVQSVGLAVKAGVGQLKDPNSPMFATLQKAVSLSSGRGTAQGAAGSNLMLFATLATGKAYSSWRDAAKAFGYTDALSVTDAKQDDPSKITSDSPGLKALIGIANEMGPQFNTAVTKLIGTSQAAKAAATAAAGTPSPGGAPAPGTAAKQPQGPARNWNEYSTRVKNGAAVSKAWSEWVKNPNANIGNLYDASFGSFVSYYNIMVKQKNVKYLSPDQIVKILNDDAANSGKPVPGLSPVTPAPNPPFQGLGGGRLVGT